MDERVLLGKRVRELRKAKQLSQEALADRMEVHPKYLGSVERGEQNPTLEFLTKLGAALGVELAALFSYSWQQMTAAELKRKLRAMIEKADLDRLREILALMMAREL